MIKIIFKKAIQLGTFQTAKTNTIMAKLYKEMLNTILINRNLIHFDGTIHLNYLVQ